MSERMMASRSGCGCAALLWAAVVTAFGSSAFAQAPDPTLTIRSDGPGFTLEVRGATRRQVLERVFAGSGVIIEWSDKTFAAEKIERRYRGSLDEIASDLLARANVVIAYDTVAGEPRMVRVLVLGRSALSPKAVPLQSTLSGRRRQTSARAATPEKLRAVDRLRRIRAQVLQRVQAADKAAQE